MEVGWFMSKKADFNSNQIIYALIGLNYCFELINE